MRSSWFTDQPPRCVGCGKFYTFLCPHCRELLRLVQRRMDKLMTTVPMMYWRNSLRAASGQRRERVGNRHA